MRWCGNAMERGWGEEKIGGEGVSMSEVAGRAGLT